MLKDRVAVITGAGNGLGRAHAMAMAAQGASVVVNDIGTSHDGQGTSREPADLVAVDIEKAGGKVVACYDSVATEEGANNIIRTALDSYGHIDILVNNAGIIRNQPVYEVPTIDWDTMVKTHLYGTFFCTRAASAIMKEQGYGRIINTSSHIGLGFQGQPTYSAVKEGIVGFSRSVARDMAPYGVTCNVIRPIAAWRGVKVRNERVEVNRPEDVAVLVVYLASEAADHINGCIFEVWRGHVGIFTEPPPVAQTLWKNDPWTPEELANIMPETLTKGRSRENLPFTLPALFKPPKV
ncbi:MAG: SDR family NAD(P)-dependent oxidoreductase [Dehalococcoidales bacterium]|nr:SDR family NAD(P)-dependent oxidoreductase [Dehalococcoidales bacterium]